MAKFDVKYTVSPMQVVISINGEGADEDEQREDAINKAEETLMGYLNAGIKAQEFSNILVEYLQYELEEVSNGEA